MENSVFDIGDGFFLLEYEVVLVSEVELIQKRAFEYDPKSLAHLVIEMADGRDELEVDTESELDIGINDKEAQSDHGEGS